MLREVSRSTTICQNEDKCNAARGLAVRKESHGSLSRGTIDLVDVEDWSINKEKIYPTRSEVSVSSLTGTGLARRTRALLEYERRFFNSETEDTFAQSDLEF